ncbi:uncharacterized protein LOC136750175 [Amia ocellicauda]|uniref:uncharacterized protein LOC136750175 n=1 Tax=Amia ocellicauda TaxID=2972642 RepID=UPI003463911F
MLKRVETGDTSNPGPLYFFDQTAGDRTHRRRMKKPLDELPPDLRYLNINPRLAAFIRSRGKKVVSDVVSADDNADVKTKEKEKQTALPELSTDPGALDSTDPDQALLAVQGGQGLPGEEEDMSPVEEYKYIAPQLLSELGTWLWECSGRGEGSFPRGLLNVLSYSWRELAEAAVDSRRQGHSLAYKSTKHGQLKGSEACESQSDETPPDKSHHGKMKAKKRVGAPAENVTGKSSQESTNVPPKLTTAAAPRREKKSKKTDSSIERAQSVEIAQLSHLPMTLSFSMSSRTCEDEGWIVQQEEPKPNDPEWTALCQWAVERLQLAQVPIKEQSSKLKDQGFTKTVLLCHYGDVKKDTIAKYKKRVRKNCVSALFNGRPRIPEVRPEDPAAQKLLYRINDGTALVYYPSGRIAICQSHSALPCGGFYTNVFSDSPDPSILGTFTAFGHGSVCHPDSNTVVVAFDQRGGMMCDKEGTVKRQWNWVRGAKLDEPIVIEVTEFITVRIMSPSSASLSYRAHEESVQLSLSPLGNVSPPKHRDLGLIMSDEKFSSDTACQLSKANRKKMIEIEARRKFKAKISTATKSRSEFLEMAKTLETLEEESGYQRGLKAAQELKKLQRKVRNILDDWMEHYRIATGR